MKRRITILLAALLLMSLLAPMASYAMDYCDGAHTWGPWRTTKEPTCTEAGEQRRTCTECGKEERKPIPGKFIVKLDDGYYINSKKLSKEKSDAFIFDDFNKAKDIKDRLGGKIVKL